MVEIILYFVLGGLIAVLTTDEKITWKVWFLILVFSFLGVLAGILGSLSKGMKSSSQRGKF